jgi:uncharacterized protein YbjT (DUF2867 family)
MKNIIIFGASGSLAKLVIENLKTQRDIHLTLFVRDKKRLRSVDSSGCAIVEGDVLNYNSLKEAIQGQDIVYANLAGDLGQMAKNIVKAMKETGVKKIIFISSIEIYNEPVRAALKSYRAAADVIEASDLDYTILRPTWFTNADEVDYEITHKGKPEKGSVISRKSIAAFIWEIINNPDKYSRKNLGINKPNS